MGERKGTNKYYPPDFDPQKHGSLSGYHSEHPLRERARKMHLGILVIRFEMPYNIWCEGCKNHIGMGVRYNAEKSKVGMYFTTPIYKFRMKCHLCDNYFEIKTDPANHDYVIISGARRKEQRWDPKENEQIVPEDRNAQKKLATDAMYRLQHGAEDKAKIKQTVSGIGQIEERQANKKDDYLLNKMARKQFREEKKAMEFEADKDNTLLTKSSLDIDLVEEKEEDKQLAGLMKYKTIDSYKEKQKEKRMQIQRRPLFSKDGEPQMESHISDSSTPSAEERKNKQLCQIKKVIGFSPSVKFSCLSQRHSFSATSLGIQRNSGKSKAAASSQKESQMKPTGTTSEQTELSNLKSDKRVFGSKTSRLLQARKSLPVAKSTDVLSSFMSNYGSSSSSDTD